jgi:hypothetical protein
MMDIITALKIVTARKQHNCNYCGGIIQVKERYNYSVLKYDDIYSWKSHSRCDEIVSKLRMHDNCDEGVTMDDFYEIIKDEFHKLQTTEDYEVPDFQGQLNFVCDQLLNSKTPLN